MFLSIHKHCTHSYTTPSRTPHTNTLTHHHNIVLLPWDLLIDTYTTPPPHNHTITPPHHPTLTAGGIVPFAGVQADRRWRQLEVGVDHPRGQAGRWAGGGVHADGALSLDGGVGPGLLAALVARVKLY